MPLSQTLNDTEGDWLVCWYDSDDNEHVKRFRTFAAADTYADDMPESVVYHVRKKDDGSLYRSMVY